MDDIQGVPTAVNDAPHEQPNLTPEQQAMVNKIVGREKAKAADAARREVEDKYQQQAAGAQQAQVRQSQGQGNAQANRQVDASSIEQQVQDSFNRELQKREAEMQQKQLEAQMKQVADGYLSKMSQAKSGYEDFDEVTKVFDPSSFPQVTYLVAGMENGGDLIYELAKNPSKLAIIDRLAEKNPQLAHAELTKLSKSISDNRQAQSDSQNQQTSAPLDRLSPSRVAQSNGKMSISDLRKQPWLRG